MATPHISDEHRFLANAQLALNRKTNPELSKAENAARARLVIAIWELDKAEDEHEHKPYPGLYTMQEQAEVEAAKEAYLQALAALVRGEDPAE